MNTLSEFKGQPIVFLETTHVKEGVDCDVYSFTDDDSRDLGIIRVKHGCKTPLQRVLKGDRTIEGHISGRGTLSVYSKHNEKHSHTFDASHGGEVSIEVGQTMQWEAAPDSDLVFYEICEPPYEDGRFENVDIE